MHTAHDLEVGLDSMRRDDGAMGKAWLPRGHPSGRWLEVLGSGDTWRDFHSREYFPRLQNIDNQPGISLTAKGGRFFKNFWEKPNEHFYRL